MKLKPLLLAGGRSSRMGISKHLLRFPNDDTNTPMYIHLIRELHAACDQTKDVYLSLREEGGEPLGGECHHLESKITASAAKTSYCNEGNEETIHIHTIYDYDGNWPLNSKLPPQKQNNTEGPAAGLLAAYHSDPTAHWLVLACDFPFMTSTMLKLLRQEYEEPATCYENAEGFCEPLLGIWSPQALECLEENVRKGRTGPKSTVGDVGGKMIMADNQKSLISVNTPDEWEEAMRLQANLEN